jgi:hypothetical protein
MIERNFEDAELKAEIFETKRKALAAMTAARQK